MRSIQAIIVCMPFMSALAISAHETWLMPASWSIKSNEILELDLTSGMQFPKNESAIVPERVSRAKCRVSNKTIDIKTLVEQEQSLRATVSIANPGVAAIWISLLPKTLELTDAQVEEYFKEINPSAEIRAAWNEQKGKQRWVETYTKCAKTFVAVGNAGADQSWRIPVGMALELLPRNNPLDARAGEDLSFEILRQNQAAANAVVGMMMEGSDERVFQTSNERGVVTFKNVKTGKALVYSVDLRQTADKTAWASVFSTLTLEIKPAKSQANPN